MFELLAGAYAACDRRERADIHSIPGSQNTSVPVCLFGCGPQETGRSHLRASEEKPDIKLVCLGHSGVLVCREGAVYISSCLVNYLSVCLELIQSLLEP